MKYVAIILNMAVISLVLLGVLSMMHMSEHASGICLTSQMTEIACNEKINPAVLAGFHINAFNNLFRAIMNNFSAFALAVLFFILAVSILKPKLKSDKPISYLTNWQKVLLPVKISLQQWLSLLEKKDPAPYFQGV